MAKLLPKLGGIYMQAVSEVATVNHMYGTAGAGLPTRAIDHKGFGSREGFEAELDAALRSFEVDLIACAGFMRLMSSPSAFSPPATGCTMSMSRRPGPRSARTPPASGKFMPRARPA